MLWSCRTFLSVCGITTVTFTILLQLVALNSAWWATFSARTELGKPQEDGHYGLWAICSTKAPHWTEDCDPLDTFFQVPSYLPVAGILGIIHLTILLVLLLLTSLWAVQIFRNVTLSFIKPKPICIAKVSLAFISALLAILIAIFASVGENREKEYSIRKGWSFWMQIAIVVINISITMLYVVENLRFWEERIRRHIDPEGTRAETYGNPTFDADSPELSRRQHSNNGVIAYTESSGHPYDSNAINGSSSHNEKVSKKGSETKKKDTDAGMLTYENECFQEHSPSARRSHPNYS